MRNDLKTMELVKEYYGRVLATSADLQTTACCVLEALDPRIAAIVAQVHTEVRERFYGCGVIAPAELEGRTVLDLGCGTGRDVFVLSKLVGENGRVIGVDMTAEQLAVARRHLDYHAQAFGHARSNVTLLEGHIEDLESLGLATGSVDLVVSNCVINLSPAKERVFREAFRVLKPGGELHFSDVYADRRLPASFAEDPVLLGECLGGALYVEDFRRLLLAAGCADPRRLTGAPIGITNVDLARKLGNVAFSSITYRAFKLDLEDRCEDYGQVAYYQGTIPSAPNGYRLDDHHFFETHRPLPVCSNTAAMLADTRLGAHFKVVGDTSRHFGLFDCGPNVATTTTGAAPAGCC